MDNLLFLNQTGMPPSEIVTTAVSIVAVILFAVFAVKSIKNREKAAIYANELKRLTNSVGAGIVDYIPSENGYIAYASKQFYNIIGYTRSELDEAFGCSLYELVLPEFRDLLSVFSEENGKQTIKQQISMRTRTRNSENELVFKESWFLLNGTVVKGRGGKSSVSAVLVDVTREHEMTEQIKLSQERFRLATELNKDVVFEYSYRDDCLSIMTEKSELFGGNRTIKDVVRGKAWEKNFIHRDDFETCEQMVNALSGKDESIDEQIRILDSEGKYVWCRVMAKKISSADGRSIELIGKFINIDRHKKELSELTRRAMRDPMTGAFNKQSTKDLIEGYIGRYTDTPAMLLIIDIDKFKNINDTYGHQNGDKVLIRAVKAMTDAFRSDDIIGRIGGDEFVVFIGNIRSHELVIRQAQKLHQVLRTPVECDDVTIPMSASIGIALFPEHGRSYDDLLACADRALYEVKGTTRDAFAIYNERPIE